jgi:hypothetical protein
MPISDAHLRSRLSWKEPATGSSKAISNSPSYPGPRWTTTRDKFYISTVHSDADVDRTLEAADEAFAEAAKTR